MSDTIPTFLLADNAEHPDAVFVVHTQFPRFILNLANDELECGKPLPKRTKKALQKKLLCGLSAQLNSMTTK